MKFKKQEIILGDEYSGIQIKYVKSTNTLTFLVGMIIILG